MAKQEEGTQKHCTRISTQPQDKWLRPKGREQGKNLKNVTILEIFYGGTILAPMCQLAINSSWTGFPPTFREKAVSPAEYQIFLKKWLPFWIYIVQEIYIFKHCHPIWCGKMSTPQKRHKETLKWRKHRGMSPISHLHSGSHLVNRSVSFAAGFQYWNCTFCHSGLFCRVLIVDF